MKASFQPLSLEFLSVLNSYIKNCFYSKVYRNLLLYANTYLALFAIPKESS